MASVDPVVVAKRIVAEAASFPFLWDSNSEMEKVALCRVVLAAAIVSETIPSSYDPHSDLVVRHAQALNALAAALRGEEGKP